MRDYKRLTNKDWKENYDIFDDVCCDTCTEDCGECKRNFNALVRLAELEDKIKHGILIELPCIAYNVKECRYQIISTKNGRVYVSKFYQERKEAEAKLKELQEYKE